MSDAVAAVDAIIARDQLNPAPDDRNRLITLYAEAQKDLAELRSSEFRDLEPAVVYLAE